MATNTKPASQQNPFQRMTAALEATNFDYEAAFRNELQPLTMSDSDWALLLLTLLMLRPPTP